MTSTRPTTAIRLADPTDVDTVTTVLTEAFLDSPVGDWLIPNLDTRRHVYMDYFRIHAEHALNEGLVDITVDDTAVALWFPHLQAVPDPPDYDQRLAAACGMWLHRFQLIDTTFAENHPHTPHHYLAFIGVAPALQGRGIGTALLEHHHTGLDTKDVPAYLEASTPASRDLYLRRGYTLAANAPLHLPEDGPPVWPMWREPHPSHPTAQTSP
jgi:GNAT superfamily N-acetyltransferase